MKVIIYGTGEDSTNLKNIVSESLEELGLSEFIALETNSSEELKTELGITSDSAFIIEEESIEFKDMIFEGIVPEKEEIVSMFMSIIGGHEEEGSSCSSGGCSGCSGHCG